jgi:hypothetical protein
MSCKMLSVGYLAYVRDSVSHYRVGGEWRGGQGEGVASLVIAEPSPGRVSLWEPSAELGAYPLSYRGLPPIYSQAPSHSKNTGSTDGRPIRLCGPYQWQGLDFNTEEAIVMQDGFCMNGFSFR